MQRVLELFEPSAQFQVVPVPAGRVVPDPEVRKQVVGRTQFRLCPADLRFQGLLFGTQFMDGRQPGVPVRAVGEAMLETFIQYDHRGAFHTSVAAGFAAPETGCRHLIFVKARRNPHRRRIGIQRPQEAEAELLQLPVRRFSPRRPGRRRRFGDRLRRDEAEQIQFGIEIGHSL